ncbi:flagellar export chaperone FliS, partial [Candidatus Latescibacterota bacterium]
MTPSRMKGYSAYQEARVNEYDQSELILMMFSGIVNFLDKAIAVSETDKRQMGNYLSKAKNVLLEIMSSLNLEEGGEIGKLLLNTYSRQYHTLHAAHMNDDTEKVMLVRNSLA